MTPDFVFYPVFGLVNPGKRENGEAGMAQPSVEL